MKVIDYELVSDDIAKVFMDEGNSFYLRLNYIDEELRNKLLQKEILQDDEVQIIVDAALIYVVERKACDYLARCEQSRFGLLRKLSEKGFEKKFINVALDFLEEKNLLSDYRYSVAWLRSHCLTKFQGRMRLLNELMSRGISKQIADKALNEFFESVSEDELFEKAYQKAITQKKQGEKLIKFLLDSGFSYKMINEKLSHN